MLRYIVKNLSGLSSRSEESPQRYRNRLFRSLSPASRYNETNEKTLETKNTLKRSQSFTKLNSIGGENLQTSWFPRIRESHKRQASQTTQFHKRQKRNRISLRAGKDLELYYRDTPIGTKFFTHEKYQLEAATPRKPDRNSNYNILENIQKLEQTVKSSGSKNLHYPSKMLKTKTKRIHSVALPKLINEQDDYEQLAKKSRKNDDFTVYPIHSTVSYHLQQNEENPVQLIQDLPVGGYAATPTIPPPPKGFSSLNQDVNFVEEAATDQADNPPKDVKAFDDSFQADRLLDDETKANQSRCLDPEKSRIPIPIRRGKKRLSLTSKQVLPSSTLKTLDHDSNNTKLDMLERRVDVGVNTESKVSFPRHFELRRSHSELYKSNTIFTKKSDLIKGKPTFLITRQFSSISKRHSFTTFPSTTYTKVENIEKKGMATKTFFENNEIVECANTNCDKKKPSVVCKKQYGDVKSKAPYPAFTECLSRPLQEDLPECPLEKEKADMLQPKEHLPCQKINLIEPVASSINNEDFSKEEVCVKEKMKITKTGLTETCANFGHTCKQIRQRDYLPGKSNCLTDINVNKKFGCKKFSTYALSDQIFSIFGTPKRPLYNFVYDQNGKGDVLMSMARKYHFFCKIADKKITEPAETSSDIKRHLPEMDYDCYKFMKLHDLQWRIDNFQKWHRLNRLNDCQSDFTRRYYSFIGDVREKDIHGVENCLIMPHDDYHSPEMREKCTCTNPDCKEAHYILMPKKDFFQKNSVCTKSSKTEEKLKKSSKYKLSDECNCLGDEDKQLQPKYPILPEQVSVSDLLFPEPVDINKKSNYMRYKYNIPNAGVTLDCDNFEESLASGKIRIKDYLKTQLPIEKDCRLASPEETVCPNVCCAPTYVDGTTSDVSLDFFLPSSVDGIKATATDFRSIVAKKKRPNEAEKRVSKADPCSQKISCKTPARKEKSCEKKKSPSVWNKIVGYFKARPDCPAPDEWKKKAAREKAERYAKAAGLCVCDPKILQKCDQTQRKPLKNKLVKQVKPETKEKVCVELPQVITCDSSQQKRSISFCAVTPPGGLKQRSSSMWLPDAVKGEGSINACSGRRLFCKHTTVSSGLDSFCLQTMQRKNFSTSTRHGKSNKSENDSVNNDSKSLDTISTNSQELIGDAFTELSQNIMDAENDHCESDNDSEDIDDNKSAKCAIGSTNLSDKCINVMTKRSYYEKGQNKNIDDINKTLEERDKQRLAEKIIRSLLEASINNHSEYEDFEEHGGNHEYGDPKLIYEHDEENVNANYTVLSRKTSLCEIIFQESEDEYTKYCQARSFANFIEGFRKMEVLSDVNYEDLEKIKTNKLVNELNKLIVDDNQTEN